MKFIDVHNSIIVGNVEDLLSSQTNFYLNFRFVYIFISLSFGLNHLNVVCIM